MTLFNNIPYELQTCAQWVVWRLEERPGAAKPTKMPYSPWQGGGRADVTKPETWGTFEQARHAPLTSTGVVPWDYENSRPAQTVAETGFTGIGFVFSHNDDFTGIDLDDTHGDIEAYQRQLEVYHRFNSYTELSPSGTGVHIIVKGKVPVGRRRASIELYPHDRFFTMTGNVTNNVPIEPRQDLLDILFEQMGGDVKNFQVNELEAEAATDEEILARAKAAVNGDKFEKLFVGNWQNDYASQSEADFALYDIIAFYSKHRLQCRRLFRQSVLGQRDKAQRDAYCDYMFEKSFDRQLPTLDVEAMQQKLAEMIAAGKGGVPGSIQGTGQALGGEGEPAQPGTPSDDASKIAASGIVPEALEGVNAFPPGLLGEIARFFLAAAPRPVPEIALAGAIAYLAGITGRAYNVSGTGLNQYVLYLAPTGVGKDAVASGVSKLNNAIIGQVPNIIDFKGPGELVSSAGLIKWIANKNGHCVFSILGEFGKKMREMASPHSNAHVQGLSRVLLQMYSKSGHNETFDPMAYSDKEKNTVAIPSPSLTILGESVPESFYESLDETLIADGLLPRFMVFEYKGDRAYLNKKAKEALPSFGLTQNLANLVGACLTNMNQRAVKNVEMTAEAEIKFDEFDRWTTDTINSSSEVPRQLWNRAHLKALKLAALRAIGENWAEPVITLDHCMWATKMIVDQCTKLVAKFETGQIGAVGGSEARQIREVVRVISQYVHSDFDKFAKYGGSFDMHKHGVVTEAHISRRLISVAAFKNDRLGATNAIKRALKTLLEADEIREMPPTQMLENYGVKPRAFVIANPHLFALKADD